MKLGRIFLTVVLSCIFFAVQGQSVRGFVRDADNHAAISGASISLESNGAVAASATSDAAGVFEISPVRPGYYRCIISASGYANRTLYEVSVAAGKEQQLEVLLYRTSTTLPDVVISTPTPVQRPLQPLSEIVLTREQTLRFPSVYFDPARLAAAYPGVAQTDDGINGLSIRGNNPGALRWRLEGVDVVNPNHLPNAGTFSDRPASSSGGILLFSAQLLDNSSLLTGAYPAGYGDALGGMMDMNLRKGSTERHEFTAQAGLIGLDLAAEGPLSKKNNNAYLANYRYSTVGLLGQMGVSFGGEKISFQDFSFKTHFNRANGGVWSVFGMGGISKNVFTPPSDTADIEQYKDLFNIRFDSRTGIVGLSNRRSLNSRLSWRAALVGSAQENKRVAEGPGILDEDRNTEARTGLSLALTHKQDPQSKLSAGLNAQFIYFDGLSTQSKAVLYEGTLNVVQAQPWMQWEWTSRSRRWNGRLGFHGHYYTVIDSGDQSVLRVEPRFLLSWKWRPRHLFTFSAGGQSQMNPLWVMADTRRINNRYDLIYPNRQLGLVRALHVGLRHNWNFREDWVMKTELYLQYLQNVPVSLQNRSVSLYNISELQTLPALGARGAAENKGLEWGLEKYFNGRWFLAASACWFQSRYRGFDEVWQQSRWDLRHLANLTAGKEWRRDAAGEKTKSFGLNGRLVWTGGFWEMPIDTAASAAAKATRFDTSKGFTEQQPDYFRIDVRVYWKRSLGNRRNSMFAMDFQNVTMQKNIAYHYFDPYTNRVETKYQLGLIPNLSWRLEF